MTDRELMQQAIEAMEYADACLKKQLTTKTKHEYAQDLLMEAGTALRERLAQPEQEPVAWMNPSWIDPDTRGWASDSFESIQIEGWIPLYTAPRRWQGLTDEEKAELDAKYGDDMLAHLDAVEAKLKEKNT